MDRNSRRARRRGGMLLPLATIGVGVIALAFHVGLIDVALLRQGWPLALVVVGVVMLLSRIARGTGGQQ